MTFVHLANLMQNWGWQIKPQHYGKFELYLNKMLHANQVCIVKNNGYIEAVLLFYLTNDYEKLYKKSTWEFAKSEPNGKQIYIDKMVCRKWTKSVREVVRKAIEDRFPQVEVAYFHRAPKDRLVTIIRGGKHHELQSTVS